MELETVRSFNKTQMNTYKYIESDDTDNPIEQSQLTNKQLRKIRPTIYKTFLKVKNLENNVKVMSPWNIKSILIFQLNSF